MIFKKRKYTLRKSRNILKWCAAWFKKKGSKLPKDTIDSVDADLKKLDEAVVAGDRKEADRLAHELEDFTHKHFKRSPIEFLIEITIAIVFALVIATVVRQMWFELYEIPTGSMRPTFREQDHLTVTKTAFGLNVPLKTNHFYFDPDLVQRTGVVIWSGANIPGADADTTYFGILPYKKRYIKRMIGMPGDSLYFYGGKIYSIDKEGNPQMDFLDAPWMEGFDHIPFMYFHGEIRNPRRNEIHFTLMGKPIGRIFFSRIGPGRGEVFNGEKWVKDDPLAMRQPHDNIVTYSDQFGIRNYAMTRLLTGEEVKKFTKLNPDDLEEGVLYLELRHTPRLVLPPARLIKESGGYGVMMATSSTVIPLQQHHLDALMNNMYTSRFTIKNGRATRYRFQETKFSIGSPDYPEVADGTYEFYYGKANKVGVGGILTELPEDHPLNSRDPKNIKTIFNTGIEMSVLYEPFTFFQTYLPHRYAYFRDGDLYVMNSSIIKKDDPTLIAFNKNERTREEQSSNTEPYFAFKDHGPPLLEDGSIDKEFIKTFGITVPEKQYLVLGDNHAVSADSRIFGFVPEDNLQGAPSLIIWPPGDRLGPPAQKPYPFLNFPRFLVWGTALLIFLFWYIIHRWNMQRHIYR